MTTDAAVSTVDRLAEPHEVLNQSRPLVDYNSYSGDDVLKDGVKRYGATPALEKHGERCGSADVINRGFLANEYRPAFDSHDRQGHRIDEVRYHEAYHRLMRLGLEAGLHSAPWAQPRAGANVARAARYYLQAQSEGGLSCFLVPRWRADGSRNPCRYSA